MYVKNNTYVTRTGRNKMSTTWDLSCCLVHSGNRDVNRATTTFRTVRFWKILPPRRVTSKNFKPRQRCVPCGCSSNDESLQNKDFLEVIVLDHNGCSSCLVYSFYLRFSDASERRFVCRILLLFCLQVACCSHCSDALACELLINPELWIANC